MTHLGWKLGRLLVLRLLLAGLALAARPAHGFTLRSPQVVFDSTPLQEQLDTCDGGIRANTDQVDLQLCSTVLFGRILNFELLRRSDAEFGIYVPAPTGEPARYAVFAGSSGIGSFGIVRFLADGTLAVSQFDSLAVHLGTTIHAWPGGTEFGFYASGPGGTWYSQDARNAGRAHALTYAGTGLNHAGVFECFEPRAFDPGDAGTFTGLVVFVARATCAGVVRPGFDPTAADCTPAVESTWGALKLRYR